MPLPVDLPFPQLALANSGLYAFVARNDNATLLWQSPSLLNRRAPEPISLKVGEKHWGEISMDDGKSYLLLGYGFQRTVKTGVYAYNFYLMSDLTSLQKQVHQYRQQLWGGLVCAAILLFAIQIFFLRWCLSPLREVSQELNAIDIGDHDQITGCYPREIRKLTDKINKLLTQERTRQTRYSNALDDLAHSLKTPLAVLSGAVDQPDNLPDVVSEQSSRMMHIVERQLQRAGAVGSSATLPATGVYLVAERIIASLGKVYGNKHITVHNRIDPALSLRCNEADLIEILGNLLDNAFKWSDCQIELTGYKKKNGLIVLSISDDGPGIKPEHIGHILQRGGRADEFTPGHGIGLTATTEIVGVYKGNLRIEPSVLGGTGIILEFNQ